MIAVAAQQYFEMWLPHLRDSLSYMLPEVLLTLSICLLIVLDLLPGFQKDSSRFLGIVALVACVLTGGLIVVQRDPGDPNQPLFWATQSLFGGMVVFDPFGNFMKLLFLLGAFIVIVLSYVYKDFGRRWMGEYYAILMTAVLGTFFMTTANDLLMFFLAVELVSVPSYVLVVYMKEERAGSEGALKYILFGAFASGLMVYGISLIYGLTGSTKVADAARLLNADGASFFVVALASLLLFAGFAYKLAAVPMHFWAPDAYQAAPTPITAFLAVLSKASGVALLVRFLHAVGPEPILGFDWPAFVAIASAVTMTLGNLAAIGQDDMKRLLAYSSIAHAGYLLMGLTAVGVPEAEGFKAVVFYLVAYLFMNLGAFAVVILVYNQTDSNDISAYRGLGARMPVLAFVLTLCFVSLIGIPPTAGFAGKFQLFLVTIHKGYVWLAVVGALNSAVSVYYYVRVVKTMYLDNDPGAREVEPWAVKLFALVLAVPVLLLGVFFDTLAERSQQLSVRSVRQVDSDHLVMLTDVVPPEVEGDGSDGAR